MPYADAPTNPYRLTHFQSEIQNLKSAIERPATRSSRPATMRKFSRDQLVLVLILGAVILCLAIYRFFNP